MIMHSEIESLFYVYNSKKERNVQKRNKNTIRQTKTYIDNQTNRHRDTKAQNSEKRKDTNYGVVQDHTLKDDNKLMPVIIKYDMKT